jgi:ferrochelatase
VEAHWRQHGRAPKLIASFHGLHESYVRAGDPYDAQCERTSALLRERLRLAAGELSLCYQSRLRGEPWLEPDTATTLEALARDGVRHVQVICPGFAVDCLETLQEIAIDARARFVAAGGERFDYIPALNAGTDQVAMLADLVLRHAGDGRTDAAAMR